MRYGSICSGVEAATLAWARLGWKPAFFAEVEPFPCAVLMQKFGATKPKRCLDPSEAETLKEKRQRENWKKRIDKFPDGGTIPNLGDFTKITKDDYEGEIDLLVGGCPCQSYSVAGLRKGLDDPRGNLTLEFAKLAFRTEAKFVLWENVPGVFSSGKGKDFAQFLSLLCGWEVEVPVLRRRKNGDVVRGWKNSGIVTPAPGGYGLAWRTLDAQYVRVDGHPRAVPQRRRRVFLVGSFGSWERAAAVLFDEESLSGHSPPERKKGKGTACGFEVCSDGCRQSELNSTPDCKGEDDAIQDQTDMLCMAHGQGNAETLEEKSPTLNCIHEAPIICKCLRMREGSGQGGKGPLVGDGISHTLGGGNDQTMVCYDARGHGDGDVVPSLIGAGRTNDYMPVVVQGVEKLKSYAIAENIINRINYGVTGPGIKEELQFTLNASKPHGVCCFVKNNTSGLCSDNLAPTLRQQAEHAVSYQSIVRRLMPVETERLMGFPDNHTRIEWNGKPEADCPDTPRYKACGNSFPVNSVRWIGMRIELVNEVAQNIEDKDV